MRIRILGSILTFIGMLLGLVALIDLDGSIACITSIATMAIDALLLASSERRRVPSLINEESFTAR